MQDVLPAGGRSLGIAGHLLQELHADFTLGDGLSGEELLHLLHVLQAIESDAVPLAPIPACPTGFLVIGLQRLGHVVVDDETDIRLVDPHAEGNGGHDHIHVLHEEFILYAGALCSVHAGVIGGGLDAIHLQRIGDLLDFLPAQAIDDAAAPLVFEGVLHHLPQRVFLGAHLVEEVGPVEARLEDVGIEDAQVFLDVVLDFRRRRRRQRDDRELTNTLDDGLQAPVFRTEVMPPFGDAVGFVDGEETQPDGAQEIGVLFLVQGFRSNVQKLGSARGHGLLDMEHLVLAQGAVQEMRDVRVVGVAPDGVHLVLHQGDERADDNGRALLEQGRKLVAQGLATPGGHDDEDVAPFHQARHDFLLLPLELVEAEESGKTIMNG